jgi:hypothetical protein
VGIRFQGAGSNMKRVIVKEPDYMPIANAAPESLMIRLRAFDLATGQKASTPWGLMAVRGQITDAQWSAVDWFIRVAAEFHNGGGTKGVKSASLNSSGPSEPPDPFSDEGQKIAKRERAACVEYESARLAGVACGAKVWRLFMDLVTANPGPERILNFHERNAVLVVSQVLLAHRGRGRRKSQRIRRWQA